MCLVKIHTADLPRRLPVGPVQAAMPGKGRCVCYNSAPGPRMGWSQAKWASPGSEGRLILASFLWVPPTDSAQTGSWPEWITAPRGGKGWSISLPQESARWGRDRKCWFTHTVLGRFWSCTVWAVRVVHELHGVTYHAVPADTFCICCYN